MESVSATGSILNASWKIATVIYELKAVGEQTRDLLDTTSQVSSTLKHAQILRRQRSGLLTTTEKRWIDDVLQATERAVSNVAALIEPARVDMQTRFNKVKFLTRGQFVLRDSPKVQYQLGRLGIAAQGLNTTMGVLCNREGSINPPPDHLASKPVDPSIGQSDLKPPPSYQLLELLDRRRGTALTRQASRQALTPGDQDAEFSKDLMLYDEPEPEPPSNVTVNVDVAEALPTAITSSRLDQDPYPASDGLQVVEDYWNTNAWTPSAPAPHPYVGRPDRDTKRRSRTPVSPMPNNAHRSSSHSPTLHELESHQLYIPYRPPGPSPSSSAKQSWSQSPQSEPPPERQPSPYNYPSPLSTATSTPQYRRPDPPSHNPPYPTAQTYQHQHQHQHQHQQQENHHLPTRNQAFQLQPPPHILRPPLPSPPSLPTTAINTEELSTLPEPVIVLESEPAPVPASAPSQPQPQPQPQSSRPTGRARVRAWLEHQSQR